MPPASLRMRVGGSPSPTEFLHVGLNCMTDIEKCLPPERPSLDRFANILDFGCGCGRTLRWFEIRKVQGPLLHGCDIDAEAIEWCRAHLGPRFTFQHVGVPPMPYAGDQFDLVYGISVFSHLPEEMQFAWLAELRRILRPGGLLLASFHGPHLFRGTAALDARAFQARGFAYVTSGATAGLPDFYQTAYHTHAYIRETWSRYFEVRDVLPSALNGHQDVAVVQKKA
jgi:SAM-dependent methyltransferase